MGPHFFSYSSDGSKLTLAVRQALLEGPEPIRAVAYEADRIPGDDYQDWIKETIPKCSTVLFVLTELSATSPQCKKELERAYRWGLPILILKVDDVEPPHLAYDSPDRFDFVEYTEADRFQESLAKLRLGLSRLNTPEGAFMLLKRRLEAMERESRGAKGEGPRLRRLLEVKAYLEGQLEELRPATEDRQRAADLGRERFEQDVRQERSSRKARPGDSSVRLIHPLPTRPEQLLDRVLERERLAKLLDNAALRLIAILGRHGIGKTSTVCSVLQTPGEEAALRAKAVAYRSTRGVQRVTAAALLSDLATLAPGDSESMLNLIANPELTSTQKLRRILEELQDTTAILAVDDAEDLLDQEGHIRDPELGTLLNTLLLWPRPHGVKVLLVSETAPEEILGLPATASLWIDAGLSHDDAKDLLEQLDKNRVLNLSLLPASTLERVQERTDGHPRALELFFAVLKANPLSSPDEVLDDLSRHPDEDPAMLLLRKLLGLLLSIEQLVVQALAVFKRPVIPAAVNYLLQWDFPGYDSSKALTKLVERRLIREQDGRYYLPTLDRALVVERIDPGQPEDRLAEPPPFRTFALFHQAAEYFAKLKLRDPGTVEDLDAHFAELDLRIQAKEYKDAYQLLHSIDTMYLQRWGYNRLLYDYRQELVGELGNARLEMINLDALAYVEDESDQPGRARGYYDLAFTIARRRNDPKDLKYLHVNRAGLYYKEEMPGRALDDYQIALRLVREHGWEREEATPLVGICLCVAKMGRFSEAFNSHAEVLAIAHEANDAHLEAELEQVIGLWYGQLGQLDNALGCLRKARALARGIQDQFMEANCLSGMAEAMVDQGRVGRAVSLASEAVVIGERLGSPHLLREAYSTLAFAHLCQGAFEDAQHAADIACGYGMRRRALMDTFLAGLLALRTGDGEPALRFLEVAGRAKAIREADGDVNFSLLDLQGLALCGLIACGQEEHLAEAKAAFSTARKLTAHTGVVARTVRLLDELQADDDLSPTLQAARTAACGLHAPPQTATGATA